MTETRNMKDYCTLNSEYKRFECTCRKCGTFYSVRIPDSDNGYTRKVSKNGDIELVKDSYIPIRSPEFLDICNRCLNGGINEWVVSCGEA